MDANSTHTVASGEPSPETVTGVVRYFSATRPAFLVASLLPVMIGLATAYHDLKSINILTALLTMVGALMAHAGANVLNDYYDHLNGSDKANRDRLFPFTGGSRFIQNGIMTPDEMLRYGLILFGGTILSGLVLTLLSGPGLMLIGLAGLLIAWAYSAPPLRLNNRGLGEIIVALGFGILIPLGADFVQRGVWDILPIYAGLPYALLAANLLYINQFPDRRADAQAFKRHWVVRLELKSARWLYLMIAFMAYGLLLLLVMDGKLPGLALLGLIPAPVSLAAGMILLWNADQPRRLLPAIKLTILSLVMEGLSLSAALLLA